MPAILLQIAGVQSQNLYRTDSEGSPPLRQIHERSRRVLSLIGYALGGEAGARLAEHIGLETSADTVLRTLKLLRQKRVILQFA